MAATSVADQDAFGNWLSGFTDGEGCFYLGYQRYAGSDRMKVVYARFDICLRADETPTLELIRDFLGCGRIHNRLGRRCEKAGNIKPGAIFRVAQWFDLRDKVVPQFDRHPLRAKKRLDYAIWKQAVLLGASRINPVNKHRSPAWTDEQLLAYRGLIDRLRKQREYRPPETQY